MNLVQIILIAGVRVYQCTISPALRLVFGPHAGCRYTPTCSDYALDAIRLHGALAGVWLALKRIGRCHPWGGCGHDPVPEKRNAESGRSETATLNSQHSTFNFGTAPHGS